MVNDTNLFVDKLQISEAARRIEYSLFSYWTALIDDVNGEFVKKKNISEYPLFISTCSVVTQLWSFMKHNKLEELKAKNKERYDRLHKFIENVEDLDKTKNITYKELRQGVDDITFFVSEAGYHDDTKKSEQDGWEDVE